MMGERVSPEGGNVLKDLYVLLGRIGGLEEYVWEDMNITEQVQAFNSKYNELSKLPVTSGNTIENRFTLPSVLSGKLTKKDIEFNTTNSFYEGIEIEIQEETLLHRAISLLGYKSSKSSDQDLQKIIDQLITDIPFLLQCDRSGGNGSEYDGQRPLHLAVLKEDAELVKKIVKAMKRYTVVNRPKLVVLKEDTAKGVNNENKGKLDPVATSSNLKEESEARGTELMECLVLTTSIGRRESREQDIGPVASDSNTQENAMAKDPSMKKDPVASGSNLKEGVLVITNVLRAQSVQQGISLDSVAIGSKFEGTVMMAGTPLCVAALTLNKTIFRILVKNGANIAGKNSDSENVCHSLVRYAHHCPDKLHKICQMLEYILKCRWNKEKENILDTQKLLMMENKDGLNPLQLATKFRLHEIFRKIFDYEVYCKKNLRDSLRDEQWYDVTEIDTIPTDDGKDVDKKDDHVSVLPTILLQSPQSAIKFLDFPPIQQVIEQKWNRYKWFVGTWGVLHLMFMICLTFTAIRRASLTNDPTANLNETVSDSPNFIYKVRKDAFVTVMSVIGFVFGLAYICLEIKRNITQPNRKVLKPTNVYTALKYPHSNIIYKWMFVLFSLCLILDFLVAAIQVDTYENYMLMAAVIIGSYLLLFFIQMIKPFSFFTALIQIAMVDLARFAIVMIIFLLAFSTAMYMVMQGADFNDDTFRSFESTVIKMFSVMLGLGDIESLFKARHPAAAIVVFNAFVLLTTVLLLNALLAIMANTCSILLSRYGDVTAYTLHYRLHKLSTILFIEDILPLRLQKSVGDIQKRRRFKNGKWYNKVTRRMIHHTCLTAKNGKHREEFSSIEGILHYLKGRPNKITHRKGNQVNHTLKTKEKTLTIENKSTTVN